MGSGGGDGSGSSRRDEVGEGCQRYYSIVTSNSVSSGGGGGSSCDKLEGRGGEIWRCFAIWMRCCLALSQL